MEIVMELIWIAPVVLSIAGITTYSIFERYFAHKERIAAHHNNSQGPKLH